MDRQFPMEETEIQELSEKMEEEMDRAARFVAELDSSTALENLEHYEKLAQHPDKVLDILFKKFGIDPANLDTYFSHQYTMMGPPGTPGQEQTNVTVYKTNDPKVFLGKYEYSNGDSTWIIRPEHRTDET